MLLIFLFVTLLATILMQQIRSCILIYYFMLYNPFVFLILSHDYLNCVFLNYFSTVFFRSLIHLALSQFSRYEPGVMHVLVTGGAGYIGSHAALRLLKDSYRVTIVVSCKPTPLLPGFCLKF